jgi:hypothetical protein
VPGASEVTLFMRFPAEGLRGTIASIGSQWS